MNHFMARLIFCFFAEDTDIFIGNGLFTDIITQMSAKDSSNTHRSIPARNLRRSSNHVTRSRRPASNAPPCRGIPDWYSLPSTECRHASMSRKLSR
jgi:restriction-modification enzyme MmeI-like protein